MLGDLYIGLTTSARYTASYSHIAVCMAAGYKLDCLHWLFYSASLLFCCLVHHFAHCCTLLYFVVRFYPLSRILCVCCLLRQDQATPKGCQCSDWYLVRRFGCRVLRRRFVRSLSLCCSGFCPASSLVALLFLAFVYLCFAFGLIEIV